jgi:hypothetical protein
MGERADRGLLEATGVVFVIFLDPRKVVFLAPIFGLVPRTSYALRVPPGSLTLSGFMFVQ